MLRLYFFIICCLISVSSVAQSAFTCTITPGASIHVGSGGVLTLHNTNLDISGGFSTAAASAVVRFTGDLTTHIEGSNLPLFDLIAIAKTNGAELILQRNINVRTGIFFNSGLFNLNGNNIFLTTNASLNGESATSHITGTNGYVEGSMLLNAPVSQNPGGLGAVINSNENLGLVIVRRGHHSQTNGSGNGNSVLRYYDIFPANNTALNATLRFNYLEAELNGLSENELVLWKSTDNSKWTNEGFTSRDIGAKYVEKTGITGFSRWTLSSPNNPLPVVFTFFNTHCENGKVLITWKTSQEMNSSHFTIERSQDGANWANIGTMAAAGNSNTERTYRFTDNSPLPDGLYRIAQHDLDGNKKHSVVVHSSCDITESFRLWPNPAKTTAWLRITTNTASRVFIKLYDNKGSLMHMQSATLTAGSNQIAVPLDRLPNGMYEVVADFMNGTIRTFRLVKNE